MQALSRQGVQLQQVTVPRDLSIPTGPSSPPVDLQQGDKVMVIRTVKGQCNLCFVFFRTISKHFPDFFT